MLILTMLDNTYCNFAGMLFVIMLIVEMMIAIMMIVNTLSALIHSVIMLSAVMLSVVMLNAVAPEGMHDITDTNHFCLIDKNYMMTKFQQLQDLFDRLSYQNEIKSFQNFTTGFP